MNKTEICQAELDLQFLAESDSVNIKNVIDLIQIVAACCWHHMLRCRSPSVFSAHFWCVRSRWEYSSATSLCAAFPLLCQEVCTCWRSRTAASCYKEQDCKVCTYYTQCSNHTGLDSKSHRI